MKKVQKNLKYKRRYNSYTNWCKKEFGSRLQKVSVNAGFTCPNRDGTISEGGCIFCNNEAFSPVLGYSAPEEPISLQIDKGLKFIKKRYRKPARYVAYFQSYSNTYADLSMLKKKYEEALKHPEITGIVIGTRPDCIDKDKLLYLKNLSDKYFVQLEFGVESCFDQTLKTINRGHDFECSRKAIELSADVGIYTCAHLILGLPGESKEQILSQADIISELPLHSIKLRQLQIVKNTNLAEDYIKNPQKFRLFELSEYIELVSRFIERTHPDIYIERISGEVPPKYNVVKSWGEVRSDTVIELVDKKLAELDSWQGKFYNT